MLQVKNALLPGYVINKSPRNSALNHRQPSPAPNPTFLRPSNTDCLHSPSLQLHPLAPPPPPEAPPLAAASSSAAAASTRLA